MKDLLMTLLFSTMVVMAQDADVKVSEDSVCVFDGETMANWKPVAGDEAFWSVKDGELVGGDLEREVPRNVWLVSERSYENFELTFSVKFTDGGGPGLKNSGVQVRSLVMGKGKVCGYQIDAGPTHDKRVVNGGLGYWGNIWDEHRRGALVTAMNQDKLMECVKQFDGWNVYKVVCDGRSIKTWINGVLAHDYLEKSDRIAADGVLALQAHKGGRFLVHFKDMKIKELPATEGAAKWADEGVIKGPVKRGKKPGKKKAAASE